MFWGGQSMRQPRPKLRFVFSLCKISVSRELDWGWVAAARHMVAVPGRKNGIRGESELLAITTRVHEIQEKWDREEQARHAKARWLIDPRSSKYMGYWDFCTCSALIFTAIFTPIEVGFVETSEDRWSDPLFLINRIVDSVFLCDVILQFFIQVPNRVQTKVSIRGERMGERWSTNHSEIARRYLCSAWAAIDFIAIGVSGFDMFAPVGSQTTKFKGLKAIRVLRLVKLVRIVNASKIFTRWEMRLSINYGALSIAQIIAGLLFVCHLFACLWGLQASFDPLNTWPGQKNYCVPYDFEAGDICPEGMVCTEYNPVACMPPTAMYLISVYWAIATVTSIGYGDLVATPFSTAEQLVCTLIMLSGAVLFAQLVGSFCGLAASMSPELKQFRFDMSDLNALMKVEGTPPELRFRLREYLHQSKHLRSANTKTHLLASLSPGIAGEFALQMGQKWLLSPSVWFLTVLREQGAPEEDDLFRELALLMKANVVAPGEPCMLGRMYIANRGRAIYGGHVKAEGDAWGTDELFSAAGLRLPYPAISVGYLQAYSIEGHDMRHVVSNYPTASKLIRKLEARWIFRRGVVRIAEEATRAGGALFHGRKHAVLARLALSDEGVPGQSTGLLAAAAAFSNAGRLPDDPSADAEESAAMSISAARRMPKTFSAFSSLAGAASGSGGSDNRVLAILEETQKQQTFLHEEVKQLAAGLSSLQYSMTLLLKQHHIEPLTPAQTTAQLYESNAMAA